MSRFNYRPPDQFINCSFACPLRLAFGGLLLVLGPLFTAPLVAQPESARATTTFLVVRHAERDGNLDKLTTSGEERSQRLASVAGTLSTTLGELQQTVLESGEHFVSCYHEIQNPCLT
ncbi:MAG: hypothetical protein AB8B50_12165 [Pirellulaceae bacterium]